MSKRFLILNLFLFLPFLASAQSLEIPCFSSNAGCGLTDVFILVQKIVHFLAIDLVIPFAIAALVYAGFLMVTAAGSSGEISKAKDIIYYAVLGIILALAASLVVQFILNALDVENLKAQSGL